MTKIADKEERQSFWTDVMRDETIDMAHRIRCSSLLGKSEGDFIDKIDDVSRIKIEYEREEDCSTCVTSSTKRRGKIV